MDADELRRAVRERYREVARDPREQFPYPVGREGALALGYDPTWLDAAPAPVVERFVGVGCPLAVRAPARGERVLDVGCGCGLDAFVAAALVGAAGRVDGVDLTPEMLAVARAEPRANLAFQEASVERLPFADAAFDVVTSNGALNLVPDKPAAFREVARVLRPGGAFVAADLLVVEGVPPEVLADLDAWSG